MITFDSDVKARLKPEQVSSLEARGAELEELFRVHGKHPFSPIAYYDEGLDCVRVVMRDCSTTEFRILEWLTVLHDNDPSAPIAPVGFTLKGISVLVEPGGRDRIMSLVDLLDEIVKKMPGEAVVYWVTQLKKLTQKAGVSEVKGLQSA